MQTPLDAIAFGPCPTCGSCVQVIDDGEGTRYRAAHLQREAFELPKESTQKQQELPLHWGDINNVGREHA